MTLIDLLEVIPRFMSRRMFPLYVETPAGTLAEIDKIDFLGTAPGLVLTANFPPDSTNWDDELCALRDQINDAWQDATGNSSFAQMIFDPTANVISIEAAYRLLIKTQSLLNEIYE